MSHNNNKRIVPGQWVAPNPYVCRGYRRNCPDDSTTSGFSTMTKYSKNVINDDELSVNYSSDSDSQKSYITVREDTIKHKILNVGQDSSYDNLDKTYISSRSNFKQQGFWDRNGQIIALWVCVICILIGVGGGVYIAINLIGTPEIRITKGPQNSAEIDPTVATKPETTTTQKQLPLCHKYQNMTIFIDTLNKTKYGLPEGEVCACRNGRNADFEKFKFDGDTLLEKIKDKMKKLDKNEKNGLGTFADLEFNENNCIKSEKKTEDKDDENETEKVDEQKSENPSESEETSGGGWTLPKINIKVPDFLGRKRRETKTTCEFSALTNKNTDEKTGEKKDYCWIINNEYVSHFAAASDFSDCALFTDKSKTSGYFQVKENADSDAKCISYKESGKEKGKPLQVSDCLDNRFRLVSANCDDKQESDFYHITTLDGVKCLTGGSYLSLEECSTIQAKHLWIKKGTDKIYSSKRSNKIFGFKLLDDNDKTLIKFTEEDDAEKCQLYNPTDTDSYDNDFKDCSENTIWT